MWVGKVASKYQLPPRYQNKMTYRGSIIACVGFRDIGDNDRDACGWRSGDGVCRKRSSFFLASHEVFIVPLPACYGSELLEVFPSHSRTIFLANRAVLR